MAYDPAFAVRYAAFSVSSMAKCNTLTQQDVDDLLGRAEQALSSDDPLFRAVSAFATQYPLVCGDPQALSDQGDLMRYGIDEVNKAEEPADPWQERKDING